MAGKNVVRLVIEVPDDVVVMPVIVHKGGNVSAGDGSVMKQATIDLTTSKTSRWLGSKFSPAGTNCCCVRG